MKFLGPHACEEALERGELQTLRIAPAAWERCAKLRLAAREQGVVVHREPMDSLDRRYLRALIEHYGGGPAGVETLAYAIAEARDAVEDVIEPFLTQQGFIQRTPRGRVACAKAYLHIGLKPPAAPKARPGLFEDE